MARVEPCTLFRGAVSERTPTGSVENCEGVGSLASRYCTSTPGRPSARRSKSARNSLRMLRCARTMISAVATPRRSRGEPGRRLGATRLVVTLPASTNGAPWVRRSGSRPRISETGPDQATTASGKARTARAIRSSGTVVASREPKSRERAGESPRSAAGTSARAAAALARSVSLCSSSVARSFTAACWSARKRSTAPGSAWRHERWARLEATRRSAAPASAAAHLDEGNARRPTSRRRHVTRAARSQVASSSMVVPRPGAVNESGAGTRGF